MIVEEQIENAPHRLRQQSMKCVSSGCRASILVAQVLCHAQRNFSSVYEKIVNSDGGNNTAMKQLNCTRNGCQDVFHAFLVENAEYEGALEMPCMKLETDVPNALIPFSKAIGSNESDQWIHFYEDDSKFERLWKDPHKYIPLFKRFNGIISPDFSVYRDMPLVMQQWNTYRGRALGHWLQRQGVHVIPNIRFGDERSLDFCCAGVPKGGTIAVGSHGCIRKSEDREYFKQGLQHAVNTLSPHTIVVYGTTPPDIFQKYRKKGINVIGIESTVYKAGKAVGA